jgi:signal transduction histidine kinase
MVRLDQPLSRPQAQKKERADWLERLITISRSLSSTLNLPPLLDRIVTAAQELTQTEFCSILLTDHRSGQLYFKAATNLPGVHSIVVPMESIAGSVVQIGKPLIVPDTSRDARFYGKVDEQTKVTTRSILAVPLIARDDVIGVLEAINKESGGDFTAEDIELLTLLGDQAAVAVQNAILFQQSDLIAEIVHEMRTPLTAIISYADLLQRPNATPDQCCQFAGIIQHEADRISGIASSFLDLARLESGRAHLTKGRVDPNTVIYMAVNVLTPQADDKQIGLLVDVPGDLLPVVGDAQRLHQVMLNLVGNAIKYCRAGDSVTIKAESKKDRLTISVADTGSGIPADALPHIFERFYRVPGAESKASGTGLGLTITRKIIEAHGGEITVSSEEGHGATFTFTLPMESQ